MSDDCYTPPDIVQIARVTMGGIDLDPCSCPEANTVVRASEYYTVEMDGLSQGWYGSVWCNPPYSDCGPWVEKAIVSHGAVLVNAICLLLPVSTGVSWWRPLWHYPIMWIGRVKFWGPGDCTSSGDRTTSRQDICMVLMTRDPEVLERFRGQGRLLGYHVGVSQ
jgi:hypothetical protein